MRTSRFVSFKTTHTEDLPSPLLFQLQHHLDSVSIRSIEENFSYISRIKDLILRARVCLRLMKAYHEESKHEEIIKRFEWQMLFIDGVKDPTLQEQLYFYLIYAFWFEDRNHEMVYLFHPRIELLHKIQDKEIKANIYRMIIDGYIACNRYQDVIALCRLPHIDCIDVLEQNTKNDTLKRHVQVMLQKAQNHQCGFHFHH